MKRFLLILLAGVLMASCAKEDAESNKGGGISVPGVVNIQIMINKVSSRAIEEGHPGTDDVYPQINTVTLISYNDGGGEISRIDLNADQIKAAIWGTYNDSEGNTGDKTTLPDTGASVGVPAGTYSVDVVINHSAEDKGNSTNINFVNYRYNKNADGDYKHGHDNFQRAQLISDVADQKGVVLAGHETGGTQGVPSYKIPFVMKPALARFEVTGAINVAEAKIWVDFYGNKWSLMDKTAYELATGTTADAKGVYLNGDRLGTVENGFEIGKVYVSEYYFILNGTLVDEVPPRDGTNTYEEEDEVPPSQAGWVKNKQYDDATVITWFPNRYYAVDVESIFINNIKVRDALRTPYLHPWPGTDAMTNHWRNWYDAFHINGWHTTGTSATNSFLCMGNMWDLTAGAADGDKTTINYPQLGEDKGEMFVITGKALPEKNKSEYYATSGVGVEKDRNLGIINGKAASYLIYSQIKKQTTSISDKTQLGNDLPHIIVKMKAYTDAQAYTDGDYVPMKEFVTIKLFSKAANDLGALITNFERGNIYRLDLNNLLYLFVGDAPVPGGKHPGGIIPTDPVDPDPERPGAEVIMTVKVLPWKVQDAYPII